MAPRVQINVPHFPNPSQPPTTPRLENNCPPLMAQPFAAGIRRLPLSNLHRLLSSHHLHLSISHSPSDQSDFEPDPEHPLPLPPATDDDGELASFVQRISSAASSASSPKDALSLLLSNSPTTGSSPAPASPALLVRAVWELRCDPDAAALAVRYGDESSAVDGADGAGAGPQPPPAEAWHLAVWAAGKARRFDLAWAVVRRMRRRGVLTRRAMVILMERCGLLNGICLHFVASAL